MKEVIVNGHIQLGEQDTTTMPPGFNAPDTGTFCPQPFGHIVPDDDDTGTLDTIPEY